MGNKWQEVWQKRTKSTDILNCGDDSKVMLELKRMNGFDVNDDDVTGQSYIDKYQEILSGLSYYSHIMSVYEVGCGSGANLYLFEKDGIVTGGIDYSEPLANTAKEILKTEDIVCDEAINIITDRKYDAVFSVDVFSYFINEEYALKVMDKMHEKARYALAFISIHDKAREQEMLENRRKNIENYDERYAGLPKQCYSKELFEKFAAKNNMKIEFKDGKVDGYWNSPYLYDCYMYKQ